MHLPGTCGGLVLLLAAPVCCQSPLPDSPKFDDHVATALKWLPDDTQTVIVANGPVRLQPDPWKRDGARDAFYREDNVSFVDLIRSSVFFLPAFLGDGDAIPSLKALAEFEFNYALEGSRRFRAPRNLGMMQYQGSFIASASETSKEPLERFFGKLAKRADEHVTILGTDVAVFHVSFVEFGDERVETILAASPRPGFLFVANDRDYLETLLQNMASPPATVAFPDDLPEWKQVDPRASVFAIRHFRRADAANDPTSPLRGKAAANLPDPKAIGLVFECAEAETQKAVARYLTGAVDPIGAIRKGWMMPNEGLAPDFVVVAPGVVEISQVVAKPLPASRFWFILTAYLGHAIYP